MDINDKEMAAQLGLAALLPGMVHQYEKLGRDIDELRDRLAGMQSVKMTVNERTMKAAGASWAGMTAEERSVEMIRRMKVRKANKAAAAATKLHPRDERHPGHAKWLANITKGRKAAWQKMSPGKQKAHLKKMLDAKKKKHQQAMPTVRMTRDQQVNGAAA